MRNVSLVKFRAFRLLCTALACALPLAGLGCASGGSKMGWYGGFYKPGSVATESIVNPQATTFQGQGLASGPVAGQVGLYSADALEVAPMPRGVPTRPSLSSRAPAMPECTLNAICDKLDALQRAIEASAKYRAMPPGE